MRAGGVHEIEKPDGRGSSPGRRTVLLGLAAALLGLSAWASLGGATPDALLRWAIPAARAEIDPRGTVEGTVASDLGHPLPDAHLFLSRIGVQLTAMTDSSGGYRFESVDAGRYVLRVFRLDYRDAEQVVDVVDGQSVRADFRLEPRRH